MVELMVANYLDFNILSVFWKTKCSRVRGSCYKNSLGVCKPTKESKRKILLVIALSLSG